MPKGEKNRKLSDADRLLAVNMYETRNADGTWTGVTTIARHFGVHHNAIDTLFKKSGVVRRSAVEAHAHGKRCKPIVNLPTGAAPHCRCGCGARTPWNRLKNRWYTKVPGHKVGRPQPTGRSKGSPGAKNPAWKGGVTPLRQRVYKTAEWKQAQAETLKRDDYHCQRCGTAKISGVRLHAHHIASFAAHPELRTDILNLVTLCGMCHLWVHSKRNVTQQFLAS